MESVLISASIRRGHHRAVREIIDEGPPFELPFPGIDRHCVFVSRDTISFLFEGPPGLRKVVRGLVDRSVLNQMMRISAHIDGLPQQVETAFRWSAHDQTATDECEEPADVADMGRSIG